MFVHYTSQIHWWGLWGVSLVRAWWWGGAHCWFGLFFSFFSPFFFLAELHWWVPDKVDQTNLLLFFFCVTANVSSFALFLVFCPLRNLHFSSLCIHTPVASNPVQAWTLSSSFFVRQLFDAVFVIRSSWFAVPVLQSFMVWHLKYILFRYAVCCEQVIRLVSV